MNYYNKDIDSIFSELKSSKNGLFETEVESRKKQFGENLIEKQKRVSFFIRFLSQFKNLMIIILIISACISLSMALASKNYEDLFESILIFAIVIVNAFVGVIQEQKAENALESLMQTAEPFSKVIRNGKQEKVKIHNVVVGDIIKLKAGDYIPADIRIIECNNFKCDESSLTGESILVDKSSKTIYEKNVDISSQSNMCFYGTSVKSGTATGIVVSVGQSTQLGKIASSLKTSKKEKTVLEKNIDKIGKVLTIGIFIIVVAVFIIQIVFNKKVSPLEALLTAVALAVAAIPESLPAVITIIMTLGVQKLAKHNAIVKRLNAIETLGCCNIICTDKTGTLTKNEMEVCHVYDNLTINSVDKIKSLSHNLIDNFSVCNDITFDKTSISGDPTESAIAKFLISKNIDIQEIKSSYKLLQVNEFNSTKKYMSVVASKNDKTFLFIKGAIDYILPKCKFAEQDNKIVPLTKSLFTEFTNNNDKTCEHGERVLAFAYKEISNQENIEEDELIFLGFMGLMDPPRPETYSAIKTSKRAGLKTIMITGDHPTTAFAIAKKLGIANSKNEVLIGKDIERMEQKELEKVISSYRVFARVSPEHKLKLVKALKSLGNIVAMTGDGINDAPSIKQANIGLSMGKSGTDVTREASDIIITDDNFSTIIVAIKEGRTIYQNIAKTILFLLSTNVVEVLGIFVSSIIIQDAVFLSPSQILFINLVTDSLPAFALGIEPPEKSIMNKPPRNTSASILSGTIGTSIIYQGFMQSLAVLIMFVIAKNTYGNMVASTMSFLTICLMQIIHAINCKTEKSILTTNIFKNKFFNFSFIVLLGLILGVYFIPNLSMIFSLTTLNLNQWLYVIITSISIIPIVEIGKLFIKEKDNA